MWRLGGTQSSSEVVLGGVMGGDRGAVSVGVEWVLVGVFIIVVWCWRCVWETGRIGDTVRAGGGDGGDGHGDWVTLVVAKTESDPIVDEEKSRSNGSATTIGTHIVS